MAAVGQHQVKHGEERNLRQFLSFTVQGETYAVDIMSVQEIKGWSETTQLPKTPEYMRGVLNLRGAVIPIFDLRSRFGMGNTEVDATRVVIVLAIEGGRTIGLLVDTVSDILTVTDEEIKASPSMDTPIEERFVNGLLSREDRMVILLDVNKLFSDHVIDNAHAEVQSKLH